MPVVTVVLLAAAIAGLVGCTGTSGAQRDTVASVVSGPTAPIDAPTDDPRPSSRSDDAMPKTAAPSQTQAAPADTTFLAYQGMPAQRYAIQLRELHGGAVLRTVYSGSGKNPAGKLPDGGFLVEKTINHCSSVVSRIDPHGDVQRLFSLPTDIGGLTVSPDGTHVAYLVQLPCRPLPVFTCPSGQKEPCIGTVLPYVYASTAMVVRRIADGSIVQRKIGDEEQLFPLFFSPDGRRIAVNGQPQGFSVIDADDPDRTLTRIAPSSVRCQYQPLAWRPEGLLASHTCGPNGFGHPDRLYLLGGSGRVLGVWTDLPECTRWFGSVGTTSDGQHLLVTTTNGRVPNCNFGTDVTLLEVANDRLVPVAHLGSITVELPGG